MSGARAEDPSPDHDRVRGVMHGGFAVLLFDWLLVDIPVVAVNSVGVE